MWFCHENANVYTGLFCVFAQTVAIIVMLCIFFRCMYEKHINLQYLYFCLYESSICLLELFLAREMLNVADLIPIPTSDIQVFKIRPQQMYSVDTHQYHLVFFLLFFYAFPSSDYGHAGPSLLVEQINARIYSLYVQYLFFRFFVAETLDDTLASDVK